MIIISYDIEYIIPGQWTANIAHDAALSAYAIPVQLISDLLDDKIETKERFIAISKLWEMEKIQNLDLTQEEFCKSIAQAHGASIPAQLFY